MIDQASKQDVAYILAASHSGSTLLALLLDSHPEICSVGELKVGVLGDLDSYLCSCRERLVDCSFWRNVRSEMQASGESFEFHEPNTDIRVTENRHLKRLLRPMVKGPFLEWVRDVLLWLIPAWHRHRRLIEQRNRSFIAALAKLSGAKVVADSSKVGVRLKYLLRDDTVNTRVVRLIRDGRGVALTYIHPSEFADARSEEMRGGGTGDQDAHAALPMTKAAEEWVRANREAEELKARMDPANCIEIHYESLCLNTEETLNDVYRFLGVSPIAADVIRDIDEIEHHIVGNGMRLDRDHTIVLDERWRENLTDRQLEEFDRVAGSTNARYGYE